MLKPRYYYTAPMFESEVKILFLDDNTPIAHGNPNKKLAFPRLTICGIWDTEKNTMSYGVATCCFKDRFEKKVGRDLTYSRALQNPCKVVNVQNIRNVSELFLEEVQNIEYEHYVKNIEKQFYANRMF